MKRLLAAAVAVAALAAAAPASAEPPRYEHRQEYDRGYDQRGYDQRSAYDPRGGYRHDERRFSREDLARLQQRIDWGFQSGRLTRHEARRLSWQLAELRDRARYYWRTDGISWRERRDLEDRYAWLRYEVRRQMHDDDYRGGWRG
jgi:opacity protein-like surface antigen